MRTSNPGRRAGVSRKRWILLFLGLFLGLVLAAAGAGLMSALT